MNIKQKKNSIIDKRLKAGNYRHIIAERIPKNSTRILDYGFGDGSLLLGLERDRACSEMYGIDVNPGVCKIMEELIDGVWLIDLNREDAWLEPEYEGFFNYITSCMSLEHTYDPWYVLKKFNKYLKHDGKLIIQVPNLQHWEALYYVLTGDFPYVSGGTWDYRHIRWYTIKSLIDVAFVAGFSVDDLIPDIQRKVDLSHLNMKKEVKHLRLPPPELGIEDIQPVDIMLPYDIKQTYPFFIAPAIVAVLTKRREPEDYEPTPANCYLESYRINTPNPLAHEPPLIRHPIVPSIIEQVIERAKALEKKLREKRPGEK